METKDVLSQLTKDYEKAQEKYSEYQNQTNLGQKALTIIKRTEIAQLSKDETTLFEKALGSLDAITTVHVLETAYTAKQLTENIPNFETIYDCSKEDFIKGLLLHDIGKTLVNPNILLSSEYYAVNSEEKKEIAKHDFYAKEAIEIIKKEAGLENVDLFSEKTIEIAEYHHPNNNNLYFREELKKEKAKTESETEISKTTENRPYVFLASQIDVYESLRSDLRTYKTARDEKFSKGILGKELSNADESIYKLMHASINRVAKSYSEEFHTFINSKLSLEISNINELSAEIDVENKIIKEQKNIKDIKSIEQ